MSNFVAATPTQPLRADALSGVRSRRILAVCFDLVLVSFLVALLWIVSIVLIGILELNALGFMPWKTAPNKGLNVMFDGKGVRNPLIAAFGLWAIFLVLTEIFFKL